MAKDTIKPVIDETERRTMLRLLHEHKNTVQGMQNSTQELIPLADLGNDNPSPEALRAREQIAYYAKHIPVHQKHIDDLVRQLDAAGVDHSQKTLELHSGGVPTIQPRKG